ncbi:MAG: primosomal protein N' [Candidatus Portnoybacteria bacterium]|nr:primosomal protein N' [Candidatus Portnoybacteria bacterium]
MYITNVIPLIKIPRPGYQVLSYLSPAPIKSRSLVEINIRSKKIKALVVDQKTVKEGKVWFKKMENFKIKKIDKVISDEPVLNEKQFKLMFWMADYYFTSLGLVAKIFLSDNKERDKNFKVFRGKKELILNPSIKNIVFSPFEKLDFVVIEDEESSFYRSWGRKPYYNARDVAVQLAKIHKAKLILKSSLPSIKTYYWSKKGKYVLDFKKKEIKADNHLVDMREESKNGNQSPISSLLKEKINKFGKIILFVSRRGSSTFVFCPDCGYIVECSDCDVPMVFHEYLKKKGEGLSLMCHYCGKRKPAPALCPKCKKTKLKYFGAGTQKIEEEIKKLFNDLNVFRMDSDISEKVSEQKKIVKDFLNSDNAVLVGTQMIFNKGLSADLVGVVSLDTLLNLPEYKGSERVFQIIKELRKMSNKEFVLQSYRPGSFVLESALANNYISFYNKELKERKRFNYPPFCQIIKLSFKSFNYAHARREANILTAKLGQQKNSLGLKEKDLVIVGPAPAFISKIGGKYIWHIILKSKIKDLGLRNKLLMIAPSSWEVEVDPDTLL